MKRHKRFAHLARVAMALTVFVVGGCGGGGLSPRFQPEISNQTDNLQFQATGMTNVSQNLSYNWENTGTVANVNQACSITAGSATLTIRDAQNTLVYTRNLQDNGTFVTNAGATGTWKIQVALSRVDGTVNFRVQKRP